MDYVASTVMQKNVKTVEPNDTLAELEMRFVRECVSGFAVIEDGKLVGVVSRTDLLKSLQPSCDISRIAFLVADEDPADQVTPHKLSESLGDRSGNLTVADIMTTDAVRVRPGDYLHEVADLMYRKRIHRVFVTDNEELLGIITPFDFVRLYSTDQIGADSRPDSTIDF